jgi:2'-phosphotransferase
MTSAQGNMSLDQSPTLPSAQSSIPSEGIPADSDIVSAISSQRKVLTLCSTGATPTQASTRDSKTGYKTTTKRNLTKLSHQLSLGLRHKALEFGWQITPDGFVPVQQILNHSMFRNYSLCDIIDVVESNDKQRYTLKHQPLENYDIALIGTDTKQTPSADVISSAHDVSTHGSSTIETKTTILCIRANQGHSIETINSDLLLQRLTADDLLQNHNAMVHGTYYSSWKCIQSSGGLSKMQRNHIHFATGIPSKDGTKNSVISGMRKTCDVYIFVDVHKCVTDNISIYKSDNGVLLTAGVDDSGILPMRYFSHVTDASGNVLFNNN